MGKGRETEAQALKMELSIKMFKGLEDGHGFIRYENGNSLDAEFVAGKIQGHGVFRYANGNQREGFFKDNILDGQVIFTRDDGLTVIEKWEGGKQLPSSKKEIKDLSIESNLTTKNEIPEDSSKEGIQKLSAR